MSESTHASLRDVPSVDALLRTDAARELRNLVGLRRLTGIARSVTAEIRDLVRNREFTADNGNYQETLLAEAVKRMEASARREGQAGIKAVINATGVVLHTNLGRAPLSDAARTAIDEATRYCSVEYDLESGGRGGRAARVQSLLKDLTGAEDALVVNNCAAAALLILTVLAGDGETIVSRGELVEIGGDFRVPDVMASSGTRMIEVGTTNRTHLHDYQRAISSNTRLIMRVHPSNYRIVGFASSPERSELVTLAHEAGLLLYEDAGSGQLDDLRRYGVIDEPVVREIIETGVDVTSFSGDKLLGSVQAGLIAGRHAIVSRLRKHPLYRALRSDKIRLAALEATLISHQKNMAQSEVPVIQMLSLTNEELRQRAQSIVDRLNAGDLNVELLEGESALGGGAGPTSTFPTTLIGITHQQKSAQEIEHQFRTFSPPIITRISEGKVLLDLRTVFEDQLPEIRAALKNL
ncbi:MAG TPA: L-seryl-tRNA(Sec) selenium transferase [Pyrinomonadaceae bacterium]|nr:L-seryl-tRNA(Sec) selenium transferase [Pyrinomonadaceae bacterium]